MNKKTEKEIDELMKDPAKHFSSPAELMADDSLTDEQRYRLLKQWEQDALELQVASGENMSGGEENLLHEVLDALNRLKAA